MKPITDSQMRDRLARIRIVLARPQDAENIGSVCRAMKTMGITDLRISGRVSFDEERARTVAVHAADVLEGCAYHPTVADAVSGCTLIAGATRRWGKHRKYARSNPVEFAGKIVALHDTDIAIVFGNESSGLADDELDDCNLVLTIPSSSESRSLNLSHAVQIVCYEIYSTFHRAAGKRFYTPVSGERLDSAVESIRKALLEFGDENERFVPLIRDILARAAPSAEEVRRLQGLFTKLAGMKRKRST